MATWLTLSSSGKCGPGLLLYRHVGGRLTPCRPCPTVFQSKQWVLAGLPVCVLTLELPGLLLTNACCHSLGLRAHKQVLIWIVYPRTMPMLACKISTLVHPPLLWAPSELKVAQMATLYIPMNSCPFHSMPNSSQPFYWYHPLSKSILT